VDLRVPGVIDRVLRGGESVCAKRNAIGFKKLRRLLAVTYESLNKAVARIGMRPVHALIEPRPPSCQAPLFLTGHPHPSKSSDTV